MSEGKTFRAQSLNQRVIILEVRECLEHELKQLSLAVLTLYQVCLLKTLQLNEPILNCLLQIARFYPFKLAFEPRRNLAIIATSYGPELIEGLQIVLNLLQLTEAGLGDTQQGFSLIDLNR